MGPPYARFVSTMTGSIPDWIDLVSIPNDNELSFYLSECDSGDIEKMISDLSDRVLFLDHGKIMKLGKPNEVIHSYNEMIIKQKTLESQ